MEEHKDKIKDKQVEDSLRWRLSINHKNVKEIEQTCSEILSRVTEAKAKNDAEGLGEELSVKGPVRIPTKILRITTRKGPCGNGTI